MTERNGILISTKLTTTNNGNQALSDELIRLAQQVSPERLFIRGRPLGLDRYTINDIAKADNPIKAFEKTAQSLASAKIDGSIEQGSKQVKTRLINHASSIARTENLRSIARKIRRFLNSTRPFGIGYKDRLVLYKGIEHYLYSAAGEIGEVGYYYRQLLDLRVAQIQGIRVSAINQSVELEKGLYKDLTGYVYSKMHRINLRGVTSKNELVDIGVPEKIITLSPDTAWLTPSVPNEFIKTNTARIGVNFTPATFKKEIVVPFLSRLRNEGYTLEFISNNYFADKAVEKELEGIVEKCTSADLSYIDYVEHLSQFRFVISARLHTNELALVAGVPVLPVEGRHFKTQEVQELVGYPCQVARSSSETYSDELNRLFEFLVANESRIDSWMKEQLHVIRKSAEMNMRILE